MQGAGCRRAQAYSSYDGVRRRAPQRKRWTFRWFIKEKSPFGPFSFEDYLRFAERRFLVVFFAAFLVDFFAAFLFFAAIVCLAKFLRLILSTHPRERVRANVFCLILLRVEIIFV